MRNVECGMRNITVGFVRHDLALLFRIPHSEFRIGSHSAFGIPHSAFL